MKPARSGLWRLVSIAVVIAGLVVLGLRGTDTKAGGTMRGSERALDLQAVEGAEHRAQIQRVVEAMDRTGAPPEGVAQGGRRGGQKGVFQNAEGRLPRQARGYWIESDVWPKNGARGAERLIFGRGGEVYWTRDHYETFVRLR